jgi:hypothetical protein
MHLESYSCIPRTQAGKFYSSDYAEPDTAATVGTTTWMNVQDSIISAMVSNFGRGHTVN